jgi:hypothetical protein
MLKWDNINLQHNMYVINYLLPYKKIYRLLSQSLQLCGAKC